MPKLLSFFATFQKFLSIPLSLPVKILVSSAYALMMLYLAYVLLNITSYLHTAYLQFNICIMSHL